MGIRTGIEYADSTVNPTRGCDGCELWDRKRGGPCFAAGIHTRFAGKNTAYPRPFHVVETVPGRMHQAAAWPDLTGTARPDKPWLDGSPRVIFIGDMADNFSRAVPFEFLRDEVLTAVSGVLGRRHRWLWFTKRPGRMAQFSRSLSRQGIEWPANLMPVTSATDQATLHKRADALVRIESPDRGLSLEPLWGPASVLPFVSGTRFNHVDEWGGKLPALDWVTLGGQSGPGAPPLDPRWVRRVRDECAGTETPFFFKQWGQWVPVVEENPEKPLSLIHI